MEMELFLCLFLGGVVLVGIFALSATEPPPPPPTLQEKFSALGIIPGKRKSEIVSIVGNPNSISYLDNNKSIQQWISPEYNITLIFEGEICLRIDNEFAYTPTP